jgi:hypothetical protein
MRVPQFLRRWHQPFDVRRPTLRPERRRLALVLESLEDRALPSVLFTNFGPQPTLNDGGGSELTQVQVQLIFWGNFWDGQAQLVQTIHDDLSSITSGAFMDGLGQSTFQDGRSTPIGRGSVNSQDLIVDSSSPQATFRDSNLQDVISFQIDNGILPEPDDPGINSQIFYVVITPPGAQVSAQDTNNQLAGGYHQSFDTGSLFDADEGPYAWVGMFGTTTVAQLDSITSTYSHELAEGVTDPFLDGIRFSVPGSSALTEIGDICNPAIARVNGILEQGYFSPQDNACLISTGLPQDLSVDGFGQVTLSANQSGTLDNFLSLSVVQGTELLVDLNEQIQFPLPNSPLVQAPISAQPINSVVANGGSGADFIVVDSTAAGIPVTLNLGSGTSSVDVGSFNSGLLDNQILGLVTVNNTNGGFATLNVNDQTDGANQVYQMNGASFTDGGGTAGVGYNGVNTVNIDGGSGNNTYLVSDTPGGTTNLFTGNGPDSVIVTASTGLLNLFGGSGNNTLIGPDVTTAWTITGSNAGTVVGQTLVSPVTFSGIANLTGDAGSDTFSFTGGLGGPSNDILNSISGTIDGGGGTNMLDYSAFTSRVIVDLPLNTATAVGGNVFNIQEVIGGAGDYSILVGNGGNLLSAGAAPSLLIAGSTASTLLGGPGNDILIGGTTAYDRDIQTLQLIMDQWTQASSYSAGVDNLTQGTGYYLEGTGVALNADTITSNGGGNLLLGGPGLDLFYGRSTDATDWDWLTETWISLY